MLESFKKEVTNTSIVILFELNKTSLYNKNVIFETHIVIANEKQFHIQIYIIHTYTQYIYITELFLHDYAYIKSKFHDFKTVFI